MIHHSTSSSLSRLFARSDSWLLLACLTLLTGCNSLTTLAAKRFTAEYNCPSVLVKPMSEHTARVRGCGQVAVYICGSSECLKESSREAPVAAAPAPAETILRGTSSQGNKAIQVAFKRSEGALSFSATPVATPNDVQVTANVGASCAGCQAKLAIDGTPEGLTQGVAATGAGAVTFNTTPEVLARIVASQKTTFRFGSQDWEISADEKARLQEFLMACKQEQALSGEVISAGSTPAPNQEL